MLKYQLTFQKSKHTELSEVLKRLTKLGRTKWVPKYKTIYFADIPDSVTGMQIEASELGYLQGKEGICS